MLVFKKIKDFQKHLKSIANQGQTIGFVPTMGALHKGHISLIKKSKKESDCTVCSIFVNPTQFNDPKDFEKYPSTIEEDILKLGAVKCDILFLPSVKEMYPDGTGNKRKVDFGSLAKVLEGEHRPGHFDGMAQVVERLLQIVKPNLLFMGLKDYQQQLIVDKLIEKRKLKVKLIALETLREKDGLAMSSRNVRLDKEARKLAVEISKTLLSSKREIRNVKYEIEKIQVRALHRLQSFKGIELEYFEIRNAKTLMVPEKKSEKLIALTAVKIGGVRLIDNMLLN
ncbi:MAG: pantoate--beta-alanine ligase [Bacteroidetes bacterium]|nr:pantoate--beta-alanine ligase [Bacteroidota bacterium]